MFGTSMLAAAIWAASLFEAAASVEADAKKMDKMLTDAGATEAFINETREEGVLIARHRPTGMTCQFFLGLGKISYDVATRGATCIMRRSTYTYALGATPAAATDTPENALAAAVASAARGRKVQDIGATKMDGMLGGDGKLPPSATSRFKIGADYWRVSVVRSGGWIVVMQTISNAPGNPMSDMQQAFEWRETLTEVQANHAAIP